MQFTGIYKVSVVFWREVLKNYTLKFRIKFLECTGGILEFLEFFWSSSGVLLEFFWSSFEVLLEFFWGPGGIFFEVSGVVLEFL